MILRLFGESLRFAADALRQNKLRTILSLLGITIGIFTIISIFTAVDTLRDKLQESVDKLGSSTIFIQKWPWGGGGDYPWWKYLNRPTAKIKDYERLKDRVQGVTGVAFMVGTSDRVLKYQNNSAENVSVSASTFEYDKVWNFDLVSGRYMTETEAQNGSPVGILGADICDALFSSPEAAIGKQIKALGRRITVIGVFKKEGEDMFGISQDKSMLISINFAKSVFDVESDQFDPQIVVRGNGAMDTEELKSQLQGLMRSIRQIKPGQEDNFSLNESTIVSNQLDSMFGVVNKAGWAIGIFSILVGGFGIANIMFVSVKERTNIIGIQKSLGAKNYFILLQFIFESIFLCLLGGLFGLALIFIIAQIISAAMDFHVSLNASNVILGVSISVIIGVVSGFLPAFAASKLDPVEAIRS